MNGQPGWNGATTRFRVGLWMKLGQNRRSHAALVIDAATVDQAVRIAQQRVPGGMHSGIVSVTMQCHAYCRAKRAGVDGHRCQRFQSGPYCAQHAGVPGVDLTMG